MKAEKKMMRCWLVFAFHLSAFRPRPSSFILHPFLPMRRVVVIDHPLVQAKLGLLREQSTTGPDFRRALRETAALMFFSATADLPTVAATVQTRNDQRKRIEKSARSSSEIPCWPLPSLTRCSPYQ